MSAIALQQVHTTFTRADRQITALQDIDLTINAGEFVAVIGPSGCGKTTMLRHICGLLPPTSGQVLVAGTTADTARRAGRIALAPQSPALLPWRTVRDNINLLAKHRPHITPAEPRTTTPPSTTELLDAVGLTDAANAYPRELSGGMQQRVALARAFAVSAPVLAMDEPFASLDELMRTRLRYMLLELWQQHQSTVVFVTHSVAEAVALADRVVVMAAHPGRINAIHHVDLPRPRTPAGEDHPRFHAQVQQVRQLLHAGAGDLA